MSANIHPIYTIGHSTHAAEVFLGLLREHGIEAVADVRTSPFSRYNPQFNRENLERTLSESGIRYVFLGKELGARTDDRSCYDQGRVRYARLARTDFFQSGIKRVIQGAGRFRIALMCAEKEPLECHRTLLVAKALVAGGQPVFHIHADGHLESHEDAMERLFDMSGVPRQDLFRTKEELFAEAFEKQEAKVAYVEEDSPNLALREDPP